MEGQLYKYFFGMDLIPGNEADMKQILWISLVWIVLILAVPSACNATFDNPPVDLQTSDLVGTWETRYGGGRVDRILIREDGTYKQIYYDKRNNYSWETPWNKWSLEKLPDGNMRLHLQGGRYFLAGIEVAERDGLGPPCTAEYPNCGWDLSPELFYDPFEEQLIEMVNELALNIRMVSSELILHHVWTSGDRGFAIFGGEQEIYRRVNTSN